MLWLTVLHPTSRKTGETMSSIESETTRALLHLGAEIQAADRLIQRAIRAGAAEQAATLKAIREDLARFLEEDPS